MGPASPPVNAPATDVTPPTLQLRRSPSQLRRSAIAAPQVSSGGYSLGLGFLQKGKEEEDGEEHGWGMD